MVLLADVARHAAGFVIGGMLGGWWGCDQPAAQLRAAVTPPPAASAAGPPPLAPPPALTWPAPGSHPSLLPGTAVYFWKHQNEMFEEAGVQIRWRSTQWDGQQVTQVRQAGGRRVAAAAAVRSGAPAASAGRCAAYAPSWAASLHHWWPASLTDATPLLHPLACAGAAGCCGCRDCRARALERPWPVGVSWPLHRQPAYHKPCRSACTHIPTGGAPLRAHVCRPR